MNELRFTFWELLSLVGAFQCVYVLVYIVFRVDQIKQVILPMLYFLALCSAFMLDFGKAYIGGITPYYEILIWGAWALTLPLSTLLILQVAQIARLPAWPYWSVLLFVPLAFQLAKFQAGAECYPPDMCGEFSDWLRITGLVFGALSLLLIWARRDLLNTLHNESSGRDRYWLILALIIVNIGFLILMGGGGAYAPLAEWGLSRTILGLAFVYLASTSLFRIYPLALVLAPPRKRDLILSAEEEKLAQRINNLLTLDKVYHEPTYSRADLAKELGISEASVSRIINVQYKKSLPALLNEQRIADAKRLLLDTNANIKIVAQEVGFNSIPSFNRVFKELEGCAPSDYRKNIIK